MVCYNNFGNGRHTYRIRTQDTKHLVFRRSFKRRPLRADVHTVLHLDTLFCCNCIRLADKLFIVRLAHVREARAIRNIPAVQRMFGEEIDVIGDNHQVADFKIGIRTAAGIRNKQGLDTQFPHYTYREGHFLHGISLIEVEASLHGHNILITQLAENQFAAVSLYRRNGEVGNILILYFILLGNLTCKAAKSGSEDNCCLRMRVHLTFQISCGFLNTF